MHSCNISNILFLHTHTIKNDTTPVQGLIHRFFTESNRIYRYVGENVGTQTIKDLIEIFHITNIPLIPDFQRRQWINIRVKCFAKFKTRMCLVFCFF